MQKASEEFSMLETGKAYIPPGRAGVFCSLLPFPWNVAAKLVYSTGIRVYELLAVRVNEYYHQDRFLTVRNRKGEFSRKISVPRALVPEMNNLASFFFEHEFLFREPSKRSGESLSYMARNFYLEFEMARNLSGIPGTVENFRGSFVVNTLLAGVSPSFVRQALGVRYSKSSTFAQFRALVDLGYKPAQIQSFPEDRRSSRPISSGLFPPFPLEKAGMLDTISYPYNLMARLMLGAGISLIELLNLRAKDVNISSGTVRAGRRGVQRILIIPREVQPGALRILLRGRDPDDKIFQSSDLRKFQRALAELKTTPGKLRSGFMVQYLSRGIDRNLMSKWTGLGRAQINRYFEMVTDIRVEGVVPGLEPVNRLARGEGDVGVLTS